MISDTCRDQLILWTLFGFLFGAREQTLGDFMRFKFSKRPRLQLSSQSYKELHRAVWSATGGGAKIVVLESTFSFTTFGAEPARR